MKHWAFVAGPNEPRSEEESRILIEALEIDSLRKRTAKLLVAYLPHANETELERLRRIARSRSDDTANADLIDAIQTILAFEDCYLESLLFFERLLVDGACTRSPLACHGRCGSAILPRQRAEEFASAREHNGFGALVTGWNE